MDRKIFVRADGNAVIGMGHLMRLLTVTDQISEKENIVYLCADEASSDLIRKKGYSVITLGTDPFHMEQELPVLEELLQKEDSPVFLLDSYQFTKKYLEALRPVCRVLLLDDFGDKAYPVSGVINYHCYADPDWYRSNYKDRFFLTGTSYLPLRQEFSSGVRADTLHGNKVLLTTGGGDAENIGGALLERIYTDEAEFHWVIGPFSPNYEKAKQFAEGKKNVILHSNVRDMAGLMGQCQLGITAGGNTAYEMCAVGLPMIVFAYAENQERLTRRLGDLECALFGGFVHLEREKNMNHIANLFELLMQDNKLRQRLQERELSLADGGGAARFAAELVHYCNS